MPGFLLLVRIVFFLSVDTGLCRGSIAEVGFLIGVRLFFRALILASVSRHQYQGGIYRWCWLFFFSLDWLILASVSRGTSVEVVFLIGVGGFFFRSVDTRISVLAPVPRWVF